ncbi:WD40 repeat-like protein, partial [Aureobasidium melanogenum]
MSEIDLSLPVTVPEMARYQDRPMTLDSFAVYNLLDPHNEPPGLVEKCNSECPRDDYVYFRASPGVDSLKGLIDHHLSTTVHEGFDPNLFLAVTDPDWEQNGVCVVTLGDDEGKPDKFIMKTEESGLLLVNLQIANTDWYEAKENAEYTGDDNTHDLESEGTFPDGASKKKPGTGFYIGFYAIPGIDPSQLIRDVEPFHDGKVPEDRVCRFEGFLKPDWDLVSQASDSWHPQAFFSPDDSFLAISPSNGGCITIYRADTGSLQTSTIEHDDMIWDISFSASGEHILSACDDGIARLFNTNTGVLEKEFHDDREGWSDQRMFVACFTPDGKAIATGTDIVQIWDLETEALVRDLLGLNDRNNLPVASIEAMGNVLREETTISGIDFSPGGTFLVTEGFGGWGRQVRIWDMQTWKLRLECEDNGAVFSVDGKDFAVAGHGRVELWDAETMTLKHTLGGTRPVFSPDGNTIATASSSHTIYLWDLETAHLLHTLSGYGTLSPSVQFTPDSTTLLSNSGYTVHIWDITSGDLEFLLEGHEKQIHTITLSPNNTTLATGSKDSSVRLWDVRTGECLQKLEEHIDEVRGATFSSDGKRLATSDDGGRVLLWDTEQC